MLIDYYKTPPLHGPVHPNRSSLTGGRKACRNMIRPNTSTSSMGLSPSDMTWLTTRVLPLTCIRLRSSGPVKAPTIAMVTRDGLCAVTM